MRRCRARGRECDPRPNFGGGRNAGTLAHIRATMVPVKEFRRWSKLNRSLPVYACLIIISWFWTLLNLARCYTFRHLCLYSAKCTPFRRVEREWYVMHTVTAATTTLAYHPPCTLCSMHACFNGIARILDASACTLLPSPVCISGWKGITSLAHSWFGLRECIPLARND